MHIACENEFEQLLVAWKAPAVVRLCAAHCLALWHVLRAARDGCARARLRGRNGYCGSSRLRCLLSSVRSSLLLPSVLHSALTHEMFLVL